VGAGQTHADGHEPFLVPRYGEASLADLAPAVLAALGVPGETDRIGLGLDGVRRVCLLVIDGLGARLLAAHPQAAPFLSGLAPAELTAGFPSTTATSLSSIGTGLPPGEHGLVGYLVGLPDYDRPMNMLGWSLHGAGPHVDLMREQVPEEFQPARTAFERAADAGVAVTRVAPAYQAGSGLTRAALRGGRFAASFSLGDLAAEAAAALDEGDRSLVYAYHSELDTTGHVRGPATPGWLLELAHVDRLAADLADRLPPDGALLVTADHGMVTLTDPVDADRTPALTEGVRVIAGEPRARHVYAEAGAADDVLATWRETLGQDFAVVPRGEAVEAGWLGPVVRPQVLPRIGDVLALGRGAGGVVRGGVEAMTARLLGHHGSLTADELLVPLAVVRG
jgi:hypothetical protein